MVFASVLEVCPKQLLSIALLVVGCGSQTVVPPDGAGGAPATTATTGGHGGEGGFGFAGMGPGPCDKSSATVALDGEKSPFAELEVLEVAPGVSVLICFAHDVTDFPGCNASLHLGVEGLELGPNEGTAIVTLSDDSTLQSEPGAFAVTVTAHDPVVVADFEGTVGAGEDAIAVTGSFAGCGSGTD